MWEYYHVTDIYALQPSTVARLLFGLKDESRLKTAITGTRYSVSELLLAHCADALNILLWLQTDRKGKKPDSIMQSLVGKGNSDDVTGFDSIEAFELARASILESR